MFVSDFLWPVMILLLAASIATYLPDLIRIAPLVIGILVGSLMFTFGNDLKTQILSAVTAFILLKIIIIATEKKTGNRKRMKL